MVDQFAEWDSIFAGELKEYTLSYSEGCESMEPPAVVLTVDVIIVSDLWPSVRTRVTENCVHHSYSDNLLLQSYDANEHSHMNLLAVF